VTSHLAAPPVLTADDAAGRLYGDLPRGARVTGTLKVLPFYRVTARGPVGGTRVDILAATLGDPRLHNVRLPDVDLQPWSDDLFDAGVRIVPATAPGDVIRARAKEVKFEADRIERLVHYPFWHLVIEDAGRTTAAWVDAVEGTVIAHNLADRESRIPFTSGAAGLLAAAAAMAAAEWRFGGETAAIAAAAVSLATGLVIYLRARPRTPDVGRRRP